MLIKFDLEGTIRERKSVRSYENRLLARTDKERVISYIEERYREESLLVCRMLERKQNFSCFFLESMIN